NSTTSIDRDQIREKVLVHHRCEATTTTNRMLHLMNQSQKNHKIPTPLQKIPPHNP
ncbi:unnamed protein product, partial [Rotaria sp. Silwood1]